MGYFGVERSGYKQDKKLGKNQPRATVMTISARQSITSRCRQGSSWGQIKPGFFGDLLRSKNNPLEDITAFERFGRGTPARGFSEIKFVVECILSNSNECCIIAP